MEFPKAVTAITGGSRGIGSAVAERLARDGHDVLVGYNKDRAAAESTADLIRGLGRNARTAAVDVTDPASVERFFQAGKSLGPLTGVVAAAGAALAVGILPTLIRMRSGRTSRSIYWGPC